MKKTITTEKYDADGKLIERIVTTEEDGTMPQSWPYLVNPVYIPQILPAPDPVYPPWTITCSPYMSTATC